MLMDVCIILYYIVLYYILYFYYILYYILPMFILWPPCSPALVNGGS